jgi:hypothetical protein
VQQGDELAVTETTRWFGECANGNESPVTNTVSGSPGNYSSTLGPDPTSLCPEGSDDESTTIVAYDLALSGRVTSIARYAPQWLGGPDVPYDKWEWFKSFDYDAKKIFAPTNERGV